MKEIEDQLKLKLNPILQSEGIEYRENSFIYRAFIEHLSDLITDDFSYNPKSVGFDREDLKRANRIVDSIVKIIENDFSFEVVEAEKFLILIYIQTLIEADQKQKLPTVALIFDDANNLLSAKEIINQEFCGKLPLKMFSVREYKLSEHKLENKIYITDNASINGSNVVKFIQHETKRENLIGSIQQLIS